MATCNPYVEGPGFTWGTTTSGTSSGTAMWYYDQQRQAEAMHPSWEQAFRKMEKRLRRQLENQVYNLMYERKQDANVKSDKQLFEEMRDAYCDGSPRQSPSPSREMKDKMRKAFKETKFYIPPPPRSGKLVNKDDRSTLKRLWDETNEWLRNTNLEMV